MTERLRFLEAAQWWDRERLYAHRNQDLVSLMSVAYRHVPFYRDLMDAARITPCEVRSPADLFKLPIVTKEILGSHYPDRTTWYTGRRTYEVRTSGSTGSNFCVRTDTETLGWYRASFLLAVSWAGWRIGEPHLQTGMTLTRNLQKQFKDALLRCHYVSAFDLSDARLDASLDLLEKYQIKHLWGYPGSLYFLARRALEKGWNHPLRSVATWGDTLYLHYRKTIEQAFHTRVFDIYGCNEGIQVAAQCGQGDWYHTHTLDVVVEYLDDKGEPVTPGRPGHLVLTRLHPGPMPLIRYRVGDSGVAGDTGICQCGRGFDIMASIQGRDTDVVVTPSGNRLIVHFFTGILEHFSQIDSFQVVQERHGAAVLRIVPTKDFSQEVAAKIVSALKEKGASDLDIEVEVVDEIPLPPSGKRRFVMSKLAGFSQIV